MHFTLNLIYSFYRNLYIYFLKYFIVIFFKHAPDDVSRETGNKIRSFLDLDKPFRKHPIITVCI